MLFISVMSDPAKPGNELCEPGLLTTYGGVGFSAGLNLACAHWCLGTSSIAQRLLQHLRKQTNACCLYVASRATSNASAIGPAPFITWHTNAITAQDHVVTLTRGL